MLIKVRGVDRKPVREGMSRCYVTGPQLASI
jgi:hypothetical protein